MRKVLGQPVVSPDGKFRITLFDDKLIRRERLCKGKILELNLDSPQNDENGNTYYVTTVQADIDGKEHVGEAIVWGHQIRSNKLSLETYAEGATVGLAIEIKSKHAGRTRVELLSEDQAKQLQYTNPIDEKNNDFNVYEEQQLESENSTIQDEYHFDDMVKFYNQKTQLLKSNLIEAIEKSLIYKQEPSSTRDLELLGTIFRFSEKLRFGFTNDDNFNFELFSENFDKKEKYIDETCAKFIEELQEYFLIL